MVINLQLKINEKIYIKDPVGTELGQSIIKNSIELIDEIGLEYFTFKKLATKINSTEASIYRYFENKHLVLIYLINWYWEWVKFRISVNTLNITDPKVKLKRILESIITSSMSNMNLGYINEEVLHKIVLTEGHKAYHNKNVDLDNKQGFFLPYKELVETIADVLLEINPDFKYQKSTATMLVEMANNNLYFAEHLPRLTDIKKSEKDSETTLEMLEFIAFKLLSK